MTLKPEFLIDLRFSHIKPVMLFKFILKVYAYTCLLYIVSGILNSASFDNYFYLYVVNFIATLAYMSLLLWFSQNKVSISTNALLLVVFIYNTVFVGLYNALYYFDHGNFFAFSALDSLQYDSIARNMVDFPFFDSFNLIPANWDVDDYGFPVYVSLNYRIISSPLLVNFLNVILNSITVFFIYKIGRSFLIKKYAQFAALVFGVATYTIFFQASGLKETIMIFLITGSYYHYYKYTRYKKKINLILSGLWCVTVFFFRVPLVYFIIISIITSEFIRLGFLKNLFLLKVNYKLLFIVSIFIPIAAFLLYIRFHLLYRYGSNIILISSTKQAEFGDYSYFFVYLNSVVSSFFGPLPSIVILSRNLNLSILSGSLVLRVYLSLFFIIGICYAFKNKFTIPLLLFCIFEMSVLAFILHSFEVRKCYPHYPFMILISMYGLQSTMNYSAKKFLTKKLMLLYCPAIFAVIFFWNFLRLS